MTDFTSIYDAWQELWSQKEDYALGETEIDIDSYKDLVKQTYYIIKEMHECIYNNDYSGISPEEMRNYIDLISCISLYGASLMIDESKDNLFAVTRLLAFDLADLGANYSLYAHDEDGEMQEGVIASLQGMDYGIEGYCYYDVNKGDLSDYIKMAKVSEC